MTTAKPTTVEEAFVAALNDVANPPLDSTNPHFGSKFSSLAAVTKVVRDACKKHGLGVSQQMYGDDGAIGVTTIVFGYGGFIDCGTLRMAAPTDPQKCGSVITYARRYSLCAAFNIVGETDDDGNGASGKNGKTSKATPAQIADLAILKADLGMDDEAWHKGLAARGVTDESKLTEDGAAEIIVALKKKAGA